MTTQGSLVSGISRHYIRINPVDALNPRPVEDPNLGIIVMLGVVAGVLSGFAAFIVYLNRRARLVQGGEIGPAAVGHSRVSSTIPQEGTAQC